jgi:predicted ester cyclase
MNLLIDKQQSNKQIAQCWIDSINAGDIEAICSITSPGWIMHGAPGLPAGPDGVSKLFASFGPVKQQWIIDEMIAEGNKVVIRATNYYNQESFLGIPSHGRSQVFTATFIHHIVDREIQETWRNADDLSRVIQLGARNIPPPHEEEKPEPKEDIFTKAMIALQKIKGY